MVPQKNTSIELMALGSDELLVELVCSLRILEGTVVLCVRVSPGSLVTHLTIGQCVVSVLELDSSP